MVPVISYFSNARAFHFPGNQQYAPIHMPSGGEKRRLFLSLRVLDECPHVLILDERTYKMTWMCRRWQRKNI